MQVNLAVYKVACTFTHTHFIPVFLADATSQVNKKTLHFIWKMELPWSYTLTIKFLPLEQFQKIGFFCFWLDKHSLVTEEFTEVFISHSYESSLYAGLQQWMDLSQLEMCGKTASIHLEKLTKTTVKQINHVWKHQDKTTVI